MARIARVIATGRPHHVTQRGNRRQPTFLICITLFVITLFVFMPATNNQFIDYDDPAYITSNPHVATGITGANIIWAFTATHSANWHPLTWLSHMVDAQIYSLDPYGHHLTNIIIHAASTMLLFLLLFLITGATWQSSFVAILFAIHPLHVESVAWVSERKDVLSCFFWILTLLLYSQYVKNRSIKRYLLVLFSFILGLMAKPMLVMLPIVLFLMDYWPLGRFNLTPTSDFHHTLRNTSALPLLLKEKIPFFVCSFFSSLITIYAQFKWGAMKGIDVISLEDRIENALIAYVKYIGKTLWPHDLAVLYPYPPSFPLWQVLVSLLFLVVVSIITFRFRRLHPYLPVGWFWFILTLVPVIGLVQVGVQSMADRYTYIPHIGLFIICAWGVPEVTTRLRHQKVVLSVIAGMVILALVMVTRQQLVYWRDSVSLFQHTLRVTANNYLIHENLGFAYIARQELEKAEQEFLTTIFLEPSRKNVRNNLGTLYFEQGRFEMAEKYYKIEISLNPDNAEPHFNLGLLYSKQHRNNDDAERHYLTALAINPRHERALKKLGMMYLEKGDVSRAIVQFEKAVRINPDNTTYMQNLNAAKQLNADTY